MTISLAVAVGGLLLLSGWLFKTASERAVELAFLKKRFAPILDIEAEAAKAKREKDAARAELQREAREHSEKVSELQNRYAVGLRNYQDLNTAVRKLEENLESIDVGLYNPHFTYDDAESYKRAIEVVRNQTKDMIKNGLAVTSGTTWTVGGSQREGERMVKQTQKLILRAFNAESESAVANVSWNNYGVMEERIRKAYEMLNKHGTVLQVSISSRYLDKRLEELRLVYEEAEKKKQEKEVQRRQRAEQREEEKVQKELLKAQEAAAKDEVKYEKALDKARAELDQAAEAERATLLAKVAALQADLDEAHARKDRAIAQAQLTKVGHVYIISNMGAFGDGVVKIGMTRRLDPEERIDELGDASVPFPFDKHALIYSENAPELEAKLHDHFWEKRLNWANDRKEFFRVGLPDIQAALAKLGLKSDVLFIPEAREYRETVTLISRKTSLEATDAPQPFPSDPFGVAVAA